MRCLVVGGTGFLGGAIVDALVKEGHSVAILSRGRTTHRGRPAVEGIVADRYGSLEVITRRRFEWVFDTCAYSPEAVRSLLSSVGDDIERYCIISSISACGQFKKPSLDETEPVPTASVKDYAVAAGLSSRQSDIRDCLRPFVWSAETCM